MHYKVRITRECYTCEKYVKCINYSNGKQVVWLCQECAEKKGEVWPQ